MALVNGNYCNLKETYLFADIARKVNAFVAANPERKLIRLGIGDVTKPLAPCVIEAMEKAVQEMGVQATFRGYGPEQGYGFLHEALHCEYYLQLLLWWQNLYMLRLRLKSERSVKKIH